MRALSAVAFLVVVTALGAVLGFRMAGPGRGDSMRSAIASDAVGPSSAGTSMSAAPSRSSASTGIAIVVRDQAGRAILRTRVGALDPERTGRASFAPVNPPRWNEAVWVRYRPLVPPIDTRRGTSYVYGHACHHHVCAFTELSRARPGGTIVVTGNGRTTTYRITGTSDDYPKSGPGSLAELRRGVANRSVPHRIVLITCAYERGDVSLNDFVVVGTRQ